MKFIDDSYFLDCLKEKEEGYWHFGRKYDSDNEFDHCKIEPFKVVMIVYKNGDFEFL